MRDIFSIILAFLLTMPCYPCVLEILGGGCSAASWLEDALLPPGWKLQVDSNCLEDLKSILSLLLLAGWCCAATWLDIATSSDFRQLRACNVPSAQPNLRMNLRLSELSNLVRISLLLGIWCFDDTMPPGWIFLLLQTPDIFTFNAS